MHLTVGPPPLGEFLDESNTSRWWYPWLDGYGQTGSWVVYDCLWEWLSVWARWPSVRGRPWE